MAKASSSSTTTAAAAAAAAFSARSSSTSRPSSSSSSIEEVKDRLKGALWGVSSEIVEVGGFLLLTWPRKD